LNKCLSKTDQYGSKREESGFKEPQKAQSCPEKSKSRQNSKTLPKISKVAKKLPSNLWLSLPLISTKRAKSAEKRPAREFQFSSFLFYLEEKRPSFVQSSDSDSRKLVFSVVSEITVKSQQNTNQKAKKRQVLEGTARVYFISQSVKFWSNSSGNKVKPIKFTRSQQSRPFVFRSTLAFCERFKHDTKINGRVIK